MFESRIELFLNAIKTGDISNLPKPQSRIEYFLKGIATGDLTSLPKPQSRIEYILNHIAINGGIGSSNPSNKEEWIVKRASIIEKILLNENMLGGINESFSITCTSSCIPYFFATEQEALFNKEGNFIFNGSLSSNDNTTNFCILANDIDVQTLLYKEFEGGRVHTTNLKNNLGINILSEVIREVKNG